MTTIQLADRLKAVPVGPRKTMPAWGWLAIIAIGLAVVSAVRLFAGATNLTSAGAVEAAIAAAVPIALAGLSGLWSERAGVVNIGLEGMMILGTFGAGWAGYQWGPWAGVFFGVVCGALGGLIMGIAAITFGVDHIIAGVAVNIVAPGITLFLSELLFTNAPGGGQRQSPPVDDVAKITVPGLSDWLGTIEGKNWFFVSDLAGLIRWMTTQLSTLSLLAAVLIAVSGFVIWRTRFGLRLRSCGEAPYAAESLGVNVIRYKYIAMTVSGAMAGLGGAFLVVGLKFQDGQTRGLGFIGLASMIFGNWRPGGLAMGAALFGYTDGVRLYDPDNTAMHAVVLLLAVALVVVAALQLRQGNRMVAVSGLIIAALAAWWYFSIDQIPRQLTVAAPYVITLIVMGLASQRLRMPKADGLIYRKGGAE
jgi:simple sugar transport system permease protein